MAKAIAVCKCATCGEFFEVEVFGHNRTEADRKADWVSAHYEECKDCYKERMQELRAEEIRQQQAEAARSRKEQEDMKLPALVGTEKQVKWASDIRAGAIAYFMKKFWIDLGDDEEWQEKIRPYFVRAIEIKLNEPGYENAQRWIARRDTLDFATMLEDVWHRMDDILPEELKAQCE